MNAVQHEYSWESEAVNQHFYLQVLKYDCHAECCKWLQKLQPAEFADSYDSAFDQSYAVFCN
jgi:hypothetical protein